MDEKGKPGFMVYFSIEPALKLLDNEQAGELFRAMLSFARNATEPSFENPLLQMAWAFCRADLITDDQKYTEKVTKSRYAAFCKMEKAQGRSPVSFDEWIRTQTDANGRLRALPITNPIPIPEPITMPNPIQEQEQFNTNDAASPPPARFIPPTVQEVTDYCSGKGYNTIDANHFINYYQARGWKLGNTPMSDWRSAVNTWAAREKDFNNGKDTADPCSERWKNLPGQIIL